jgi:CO dehydrogenase maturation factor
MTTWALAGKGGTGKTTLAALIIRGLVERGMRPILAIDADPAANLHLALGMDMPFTVGQIREEMAENAQAGQLGLSISRRDWLDQQVRMALEEGEHVDLLAMGRPEGQGCYCAANHMLREIIDNLSRSYPFVVMDNEAGMEHISRRTTRDVDLLLLVSDPTVRGLRTAAQMAELARQVEVNVRDLRLVLNRVPGELPPPLQDEVEKLGIPLAAQIPADPAINHLDAMGEPLVGLGEDSPAWRAVQQMIVELLAVTA